MDEPEGKQVNFAEVDTTVREARTLIQVVTSRIGKMSDPLGDNQHDDANLVVAAKQAEQAARKLRKAAKQALKAKGYCPACGHLTTLCTCVRMGD